MTSEQYYVLPVAIMIETMKESSFLVRLHTYFSSLPNSVKEPCVAELIVGQGKIHVCTIMTRTGHLLLEHAEAIAYLQQCGNVEWELLPIDAPHVQTVPVVRRTSSLNASSLASGKPTRRVPTLTNDQLQALSHEQKHVFALVDGIKTIEYIARLLSKSPRDVQRLLQTLQHLHLISL